MRLPIHTPYKNGEGGVKVGLEPIKESDWLEIDDLFNSEIELKKDLYDSHFNDIHKEVKESYESQVELLDVLETHLEQYHPNHKITSVADSLPLKNASLMVQEDLVLMLPRGEEYFLGAASLCAPSNWSLKEKFKNSLLGLHIHVPAYEKEIVYGEIEIHHSAKKYPHSYSGQTNENSNGPYKILLHPNYPYVLCYKRCVQFEADARAHQAKLLRSDAQYFREN